MLTRVKSAVATFMGGVIAGGGGAGGDHSTGSEVAPKFPYGRPEFLGLSPDEVECSADHSARPIVILKESKRLPWSTGYAEVINAGKSTLNEDQACCDVLVVKRRLPGSSAMSSWGPKARRRSSLPNGEVLGLRESLANNDDLAFHYWGLFDGHAGCGAAVVASRLLHHHIALHLQEVMEILCTPDLQPPTCLSEEPVRWQHQHLNPNHRALSRAVSLRGAAGAPGSPGVPPTRFFAEKKVSHESLVVGAIENAFKDMDVQIEKERAVYNTSGGCTALVVLCLLGKLYVGNAGDSRAIIIRGGEVIPMSREFTPESERRRLQFLAYMQPHLLGNEFTHLEFPRRVQRKEVGKRMLYRDFTMSGWAYKTIEDNDLKFPLIYGEGKKARVLATIGVTRGFGDHNLKVHDSNIYIKPFLSCCPEVNIYPLGQYEHDIDDVLVLGTDGLWDVLCNQEVAEAVTCFLANCDPDDQHRYSMAAQDLVMKARGVLKDGAWRISGDRLGSGDDISVYVIPLVHCNELY
ncbi:protein phosphatase 1H [Corythoichthys intestinalis]|uniref:protein phosphatase 1H n=1 Tax=Corythoichthys intestinalis TaxID=161448 RepID=UPI0025A67D65|nr:protein phosphatase 1H [Corythoichthys intestinalis]XP_061812730.1 protein phosphatase 1H-like [Nerophis lumbriciformis]